MARLETFADGVFAIAATLLILSVDSRVTGGHVGGALTHAWPSYVAYAVSFVTIGIMWVNHHTVMAQIDRTDRRFLFANIGLLMCIASCRSRPGSWPSTSAATAHVTPHSSKIGRAHV